MTTASLTAPALDSREIADLLNTALETQAKDSPLDALDRCDRCRAAACATFTFTSADILLCAHDMRNHLAALMAQKPTSFWIDPDTLWKVKGVKVPERDSNLTGDGLTDS